MLFSSITFLFMFLPIVMAVYYLVPNGAKNIVLLLASLFFYAWGEPVYVVLMILSIVLNYFCGRDIEANADNPKKAKLSLVFALTANILILGFFKYYGFLLDTVNSFLTTDIPYRVLPLPIGISFYTFQAISYVIDIYRKDAKPQQSVRRGRSHPAVRFLRAGRAAERKENRDRSGTEQLPREQSVLRRREGSRSVP